MPDVLADYALDITCDHPGCGELPKRLVARVLHVPPPQRGALGWLQWREGVLDELEDEDRLQTYYDVAVFRDKTFGRRNPDGSHLAPGDLVPGMTEARWRFRCPDCGDTVERRHSKLEPVLEHLRRHGVPEARLVFLRAFCE